MPADDAEAPAWPTCQRALDPPCTGIQAAGFDGCVVHLDDSERERFLISIADTTLNLHGTVLDQAALNGILQHRTNSDGRIEGGINFERVHFTGPIIFTPLEFTGQVQFTKARFDGDAQFAGCRFHDTAWFQDTTFAGFAGFDGIRFAQDAFFAGARFGGGVTFARTQIDGGAALRNIIVADNAVFTESRFNGVTQFDGAKFSTYAAFMSTAFGKDTYFLGTRFDAGVSFAGATFSGPTLLDIRATELLLLNTRFDRRVELLAETGDILLDGARFKESATVQARYATVSARNTIFDGPSTISQSSRPTPPEWPAVPKWISEVTEARTGTNAAPRDVVLLSLRGTDVSNLTLSDVHLGGCQLAGTHRLDALRIDGQCTFATAPSWRGRRRILAEEARLRGWRYDFDSVESETARRLAVTYRALRKSFEDSKNEPGAGDFYYGEMEMRRRGTPRVIERLILTGYWLLSGYGQRAWRALVALLVVVLTVAGLLWLWGQPGGHAARIAVGAVVFRDDRTDLTEAGEWTVLVARFLGPVLLALAVLAVRARVKR